MANRVLPIFCHTFVCVLFVYIIDEQEPHTNVGPKRNGNGFLVIYFIVIWTYIDEELSLLITVIVNYQLVTVNCHSYCW